MNCIFIILIIKSYFVIFHTTLDKLINEDIIMKGMCVYENK